MVMMVCVLSSTATMIVLSMSACPSAIVVEVHVLVLLVAAVYIAREGVVVYPSSNNG